MAVQLSDIPRFNSGLGPDDPLNRIMEQKELVQRIIGSVCSRYGYIEQRIKVKYNPVTKQDSVVLKLVRCSDLSDLLEEAGITEPPRKYLSYVQDYTVRRNHRAYLSASMFATAIQNSGLMPRLQEYFERIT